MINMNNVNYECIMQSSTQYCLAQSSIHNVYRIEERDMKR